MLVISIPSRGRVGNQITLHYLPLTWAEDIHFWCPKEEIEAHRRQPYAAKIGHYHSAPLGIAASRQAQVEWAYENGIEWLWFMDDDLKFLYRPPGANIAITFPASIPHDDLMHQLGGRIVSFFDRPDLAIVGVSRVVWLHHPLLTETDTHVILSCWAVRIPILFKEGVRFDKFGPLFSIEDYHVRLALAANGYSALAITDFAWKSDGNTPGGCSLYRDAKAQTEYTNTLIAAYPDLVTLGKGKGNWNSVNPKVNWKKALKSHEM
jgi:hypothetical protein